MSQTGQDRPSVLRAARERTRAEITRQILDAARRHLATEGASGLSLRAILADAAAGPPTPATAADEVPPGTRTALAPARATAGPDVPDALLQRGLMAWAALFGTISFELFGQLHGLVGDQPGDHQAFF